MTAGQGRRLWVLVPLMAGGLALSSSVSGAAPTPESGFAAVASASGGRVTFSVPGFAVVEDVIDGGGPVSQAAVDAGGSTGFASLPYPGDSAIAFPGLFNAVTGQPFPGAYPLYVAASHPTAPEQELADPSGSYRLRATAAAGEAAGLAQLTGAAGSGPPSGSGGTSALATVGRDGDAITVKAETRNEALQIGGGALRIASVRSLSTTTHRPDQPNPASHTELEVVGGSAGAYTFGYGPGGLVVASQGVPIPASQGLAQLNQALAPAGVSLRIVGGQESPAGASADTLEITAAGQAPIPGTPPGVVRLRLGGASSSISLGQSLGLGDPAGAVGDIGATPPETPAAAEGAPATAPQAAPLFTPEGADVRTGGASSTFGSSAGAGLSGGGEASLASGPSADTTATEPTAPSQTVDGVAASAVPIYQPRRLAADGFLYGALLAAAIALLVVAGLWRGKGVSAK
ncbi:MAG: hypothetical protein LC792_21050 [Actinobacteria bacterium]|nr:hypothetical protein [Actinomycetota bacterium]